MDQNEQPARAEEAAASASPAAVDAALVETNEGSASPNGAEASHETGDSAGKESPAARRRRPRRKRGGENGAPEPAAAAGFDSDEPQHDPAPDGILQQIGEMEVTVLGEPVPLLRREADGELPGEEVLVPEAAEEVPFPELELLPSLGGGAAGADILPLTPELLAEVRGVGPQEISHQQAQLAAAQALQPPSRPRHRDRDRDRDRDRPPQPAPVVEEPAGPAFILVQEALLESAPEEWTVEDRQFEAEEALPGDADRARRRRRRGRDRDRDRRAEAAPVEPPPAGREVPPRAVTIVRGEDEQDRADRLERSERDRRERETRADREYKEILVNVDDRETRIAVLENGRLVELHMEREERVVGNVLKGRVCNVLPGMDAAFVDVGLERNAFLYVGDILFEDTKSSGEATRKTSRDVRIKDLAKPGQEILVQVVKGPRGTKGARVSTKMSIPGRYLVLMPDGDHLGVSRKVEDARERERLRRIAEQLRPKGFGLIVRTEAEDRTEQELRADLDYLMRSWNNIVEKTNKVRAPALIHKDLGMILKTIRDLFGSDVDKLVIDSAEEFEKIVDTLNDLAPDLVDRVHLYEEPEPLFSRYHLEEEIDKLLRRKVWLRNGAYLLLDTTEALTTIDVNTGKFVGTSSLAETILKTNLDAVDEIARQLRLRDIGGMIVLDFIDMASSRDRQLVMRALENAFKKDRTRTKIAHISPLGLVEMTRKRTAESVTDVMSHTCPYCQGRGKVWSPETVAIQIERAIMQLCAREELDAVLVHANPEVTAWVVGAEGESVERMERIIRRPIYVRARQDFHTEKFEVMPGDMMEMEQELFPYHGGQVVECKVDKIDLITPPRSAAWVDGYFVDLANGVKFQDQTIRVRLTDVRRSFALGDPVPPSTAVDRSEPI